MFDCCEKKEERVLDKIMLPELHLMMSVVNHLFNLMVKLWPDFLEWIERNDILLHRYQGGGLDGRNSSKLLCKLDLLQLELPINLHPVLETLKIFSCIVGGCFSYELCTDYKEKIMVFKDIFKNLMMYSKKSLKFLLSKTWKVYCVTAHLEDMLTKQGKGMAHFAEQTGEASHHKMKPVLARHSRSENHKDH